ncbi:MAG TPA: hypothetical protein VFH51_17285 [Myxococcota bacterium]|nr:hypothetical protein [Myxococcota bacterium]
MGTSAYTGYPFWRGVFAGARCGAAVVFAGLTIMHSGSAEAVPSPLSAALLAQAAIFAVLFTVAGRPLAGGC